ncbi:uncharacterized protein N7483_012711 [Penicillium malachiteum]|uniref:uncharacterized protein n=1 Tax=Penicillium malachiteum TaxID=1324776 RepID=UPI0025474AC6|nr:uncharacterized protein N7483_012711 [Penicillium malachiteum]KAJ5715530.1 hypothetical protein N7483_012711 [Penicillium malachiteum]
MSITNLPLELLTRICENLEPKDWGAFRVTCRQIHDNTLEAYTARYFRKITLLLTPEGLERLEQITTSKTLRSYVEEIWIIPNLFENWAKLDRASFTDVLRPTRLPPTEESKEIEAELEALFAVFEPAMKKHDAILQFSGLFNSLEKCLPRLKNAVTLGLRTYDTSFLLKNAAHTDFTCLGLRELKSQFKYKNGPMRSQPMPYMPYGLAFSQLLNAIIKSNRKVQALHTCGRFFPFCGMKLEQFQLPEAQYQLLLPILKDLTSLHMCLRLKDHENETFNESTFNNLHKILITVSPTLKTLTFAQWSPAEELSPLYFKDLAQKVQFSQLEELHLHSVEVKVNSLEEFLKTAAPTLKRLTMWLVSLVDEITSVPDPGPLTEDSRIWVSSLSTEVKTEMQELWRRVFKSWADHLKLQYVQMSNLGYRGRFIMLKDPLYMERGQPDAQLSPGSNLEFYFDSERASVSFKEWVTQLQIEMCYPNFNRFGGPKLPGTSNIVIRCPGFGNIASSVCMYRLPTHM